MFKLVSIAVLTTTVVAGTAYAQSSGIDVNVPVISVPIGSGSTTSQNVLGAINTQQPSTSIPFGITTVVPATPGAAAPGISGSAPGLSGAAGPGLSQGRGR